MTLSEIRADAFRLLGEPATPAWWTAAEGTRAVNSAQRLFAALTFSIEQTTTVTLTGGSAWLLLPDLARFLVPLRVSIEGGARLMPTTFAALAASNARWQQSLGAPSLYANRGMLLAVTRQPASDTTLELLYAATPAALALDGDTPEIPVEDHGALAHGAAYLMALKAGGSVLKDAQSNLQRFYEAIQRRAAHVRARAVANAYDRMPYELKKV